MVDIASLEIRVDSSGVRNAQRDLDSLRGSGERATQSFSQLARETFGLGNALKGLAAGLSAMAIYESAKNIVQLADNMTMLESRIKIATKSIADYQSASKALTQISLQTGSSLEGNVTMFGRLNKAVESMGGSIQTTLGLTKTLSEGLRISGASASEARSVMIQLSQALSSGVLRGDEFNSIMENGSRVVDALTVATGKTRGELRAMAADGQLTASVVINALQSQAAAINKDFANIPLTISAAYENLTTSFQRYIQGVNEASGTTASLAQSFNALAQNLTPVIEGILTLGKIAVTVFAAQMTTSVLTYGAAMTQAIVIERAHTAAITMDLERTVAIAAARQAQTASDLAAAQATLAHTTATMSGVAATDARYAATVAVNAATAANIAATETLTAAQSALTASTVSLGVTMRTLLNPLNLINLGFAALVGWQFGSYLSEQFVQVRIAALSFVGATLSGFERIKAFAINTGSAIEAIFTGAFNSIKGAISASSSAISSGLSAVGLDGMAAKLNNLAAGFKPTTSAFDSFKASVQATNGAMNSNIKAIDDNIVGLVSYELAGKKAKDETVSGSAALNDIGVAHDAATDKVKKHASAHKGLSDAQKAAKKDMQDLTNFISNLATPQEKFNTEMAKATGYYNAGKIDLELYNRALAKYQDDLLKASDNAFIAVTAQEKLNEAYQKASDLFAGGKISQAGYGQMLDDATKSYHSTIDLKVTDSSSKELDAYNKLIDDTINKTHKLGATNSAVFDSALGGISALAGAFENVVDSINSAVEAQNRLNEAKNAALNEVKSSSDDEFGKAIKEKKILYDFDIASKKATEEKTAAELSGARQIAGAAAKLFQEKSTAAKAFHAIEQTIAVAQMALQVQSIASNVAATASGVVAGAAKFFAQSGWAAFAGIAAMIGVIGALGGSTATPSMPAIDESTQGTALGDRTKSSTTTDDITKTMEDIHASEYLALLNINDSIKGLNRSILSAVTGIFQRGDMATPNLPNNTTSMFINTNNEVSQNILSGKGNTLGAILDGWMFELTQFIETKKTTNYLFGHRVKTNTTTNDVSDQTNRDVTDIFKNIGQVLIESGKIFGTDVSNAVKNLQIPDLKIDIKGMTGEEATKYLNSYISTTIDKLATDIFPLLQQYQAIGEGMGATVVRVAGDVGVVISVFENLGVQLPKTAEGLIHISEALVSAAGGIDKLQTGLSNFYRNFYTEQEQFNTNQKFLEQNLKRVGVELPDDRIGYRNTTNAALTKSGIDADIYAAAKKQLDAAFDAAYEPWLQHLEIRRKNAEKYGGEDLRLYQEDLKKAEAAAEAATKSNSNYVASLKETSEKSAKAANLLLEQSDNANQYYTFLEEGMADLREQALLMATNIKDGTYTVDTSSKTFTATLLKLADAMGSADRAAQALKVSNTLGFSKNEQAVNIQQTAQAAFDNEAKKWGLEGLKFDDAVSASKNVNAGIRSGTLDPNGFVDYNGKTYSVAGILAFNLDFTKQLEEAMANTISSANSPGNGVYSSPSGDSLKVVADPSKVLTSTTNTSSSSTANQDLSKGIADAAKNLADFMKPFQDASAMRGMDDYQKELYQLSEAYKENLKQADALKVGTANLDLITQKYNDDVKAITDKKAQALTDFMQTFVDDAATKGMTDYQKEIYSLEKSHAKNIESAKKLGATEADLQLITDSNTRSINDRISALKKERDALVNDADTAYFRNYTASKISAVAELQAELLALRDKFVEMITTLAQKGGELNDGAHLIQMALATGTAAYEKAAQGIRDSYAQIQNSIQEKQYTIADRIIELTNKNGLAEIQRLRAVEQLKSSDYQTQLRAADTLFNLESQRYQAELDSINAIIDATKSIKKYIDDFKLSELATLSPEAKLAEAKRQYEAQLKLAQSGDATAMTGITGVFQSYAEAASKYYGSGVEYQKIIASGLGDLGGLTGGVADPAERTARNTDEAVKNLKILQLVLTNISTEQTSQMTYELQNLSDITQRVGRDFLNAMNRLATSYGISQTQLSAALNAAAEDFKNQQITAKVDVIVNNSMSSAETAMITELFTAEPEKTLNAVIGMVRSGELATPKGLEIFDNFFSSDGVKTFHATVSAVKSGMLTTTEGITLFDRMFSTSYEKTFTAVMNGYKAGWLTTDEGLWFVDRMSQQNPSGTFSMALSAYKQGFLNTDEGITIFQRIFAADPMAAKTAVLSAVKSNLLSTYEGEVLFKSVQTPTNVLKNATVSVVKGEWNDSAAALGMAGAAGGADVTVTAKATLTLDSVLNDSILSFGKRDVERVYGRIADATELTAARIQALTNLTGNWLPHLWPIEVYLDSTRTSLNRTLNVRSEARSAAFPTFFAMGGIADKPSIFGEAGPEAAVPLPDGRSIPVTLSRGADSSSKETVEELKNAVAELKSLRRENNQKQDTIAQRLAMLERKLAQIEANGALASAA